MPNTSRLNIPYPLGGEAPDTNQAYQNIAEAIDNAVIYNQGLLANRPVSTGGSPGIQGRLYYGTDTGLLYYDTGTSWVTIGPLEQGATVATSVAGLGSTYNGKVGQLRLGASPYYFYPLVYNSTYAKWVGPNEEYILMPSRSNNGSVAGNQVWSNLDPYMTLIWTDHFYELWQAGLRPQIRLMVQCNPNAVGVAMKFRSRYIYFSDNVAQAQSLANGGETEVSGNGQGTFVVKSSFNNDLDSVGQNVPSGGRVVIQLEGWNTGNPTSSNYVITAWWRMRWVSA